MQSPPLAGWLALLGNGNRENARSVGLIDFSYCFSPWNGYNIRCSICSAPQSHFACIFFHFMEIAKCGMKIFMINQFNIIQFVAVCQVEKCNSRIDRPFKHRRHAHLHFAKTKNKDIHLLFSLSTFYYSKLFVIVSNCERNIPGNNLNMVFLLSPTRIPFQEQLLRLVSDQLNDSALPHGRRAWQESS